MKKYINIPNALSLTRIVFLPLFYFLVINDYRLAFLILYIVIGSTDALDGKIARKFNMVTDFGKDLDALADAFLYASTAWFIYMLYPSYILPWLPYFYVLLGVIVLSLIVSSIFAKKPIILHTHILRTGSAMVYALMILSYFFDTNLFIATIITVYIIGFIEAMAIFVIYGNIDSDTRSIFDLMNKKDT